MRTRFDLIIFDCDGVVVDSEPIADRVFGAFIAELGLPLSEPERRARFLGHSLAECVAMVETEIGRRVSAAELDRYRARRNRALGEEVEPVAGIRDVLMELETPYCIASSGEHAKMQTTLSATGLLPFFAGRIYSATEVARAKPAPDVFLHAARQMGALPRHTAVVEDSVNGVRAGRAAGMSVFGFAAETCAAELDAAGADATFSKMGELLGLLQECERLSRPNSRGGGNA